MDDALNLSSPDARRTRRELLMRRLAQMLDEMRLQGIHGPEAFEDLLRQNPPPITPIP